MMGRNDGRQRSTRDRQRSHPTLASWPRSHLEWPRPHSQVLFERWPTRTKNEKECRSSRSRKFSEGFGISEREKAAINLLPCDLYQWLCDFNRMIVSFQISVCPDRTNSVLATETTRENRTNFKQRTITIYTHKTHTHNSKSRMNSKVPSPLLNA